jgi:hypothetical protein
MQIARPSRTKVFPILKVDGADIALWMPKKNGFSKRPARDPLQVQSFSLLPGSPKEWMRKRDRAHS